MIAIPNKCVHIWGSNCYACPYTTPMNVWSIPTMHTFSPNLGTDPVVISLRGMECMKDDPSAVDVLYAKVCLTDGTDRLILFCVCLMM